MSRGFPSMTALLGLLAVAGYQNRDKLAEMLSGIGQKEPGAGPAGTGPSSAGLSSAGLSSAGLGTQGGLDKLLGNLGSALQGSSVGNFLGGGLRDLVESFKQNGQGETADSWVKNGPNKEVAPQQLEKAIPAEVLATLSEQTGLTREQILSRLSTELPKAVDKYTPDGRIPAETA